MAQPKKKIGVKPEIVGSINDLLAKSEAVILTEYRGLSVPQTGELRKKLNESTQADYSVVKNTLFKRAAEGVFEISDDLSTALNGPTAAIFAFSDPIATSKAVTDYIAANRNTPLKIKGGVVGGKFYTAAQIDALAKVPAREVLVAQILGSINAPISGVVGALNAVVADLVYTLSAVADQKQAAA